MTMYGLPDYLDKHLKILFVGFNPGIKAAKLNHHYAGRGNQFWKLLYESGLTGRLFKPQEDYLLLEKGYGLTNIVSRPSKSSSDLSSDEMRQGAVELKKKIEAYHPKMICFLGKDVYRHYVGLKTSTPVDYGPVMVNDTKEAHLFFLAPNPSARSRIPYAVKLEFFSALKILLHKT